VNSLVPKQLMLRLMDKLARDDGFRGAFERNPKDALLSIGFAADTLTECPTQPLPPNTLAAKERFETERERVREDLATAYACMVIPTPLIASRRPQTTIRLDRAA